MVAFQFPPFSMSSAVQRTLRFVQHLPAHGWQPLVLTADPRCYTATATDLLKEVPEGTVVRRAFGLDTARHLSIAGRYPEFLARPDRWMSWAMGAVPAGMKLIREYRPDVIWSTYPIASAHRIALKLHQLSGIPLVADFRDPMAQEGYPANPRTHQAFREIEEGLARNASTMVFVTPSALKTYRERFPAVSADHFALIENGFDEPAFAAAERELDPAPLVPGRLTLLHSGIVYPSERDPTALFQALGRLHQQGRIAADWLRLRFRAPVHEDLLRQLAASQGISEMIEVLPAVPYRDALREMLRADGLVVMQASNCNEQIPAKLYEYLRARRPILGLADPAGDTGRTLLSQGITDVARLEDTGRVEAALLAFLDRLRSGTVPLPAAEQVALLSRQGRAAQLAAVLERACAAAARRAA